MGGARRLLSGLRLTERGANLLQLRDEGWSLRGEGFCTWTNNPAIALYRLLFAARFCLRTLESESSDRVACSAPRCFCCAMVRESRLSYA